MRQVVKGILLYSFQVGLVRLNSPCPFENLLSSISQVLQIGIKVLLFLLSGDLNSPIIKHIPS